MLRQWPVSSSHEAYSYNQSTLKAHDLNHQEQSQKLLKSFQDGRFSQMNLVNNFVHKHLKPFVQLVSCLDKKSLWTLKLSKTCIFKVLLVLLIAQKMDFKLVVLVSERNLSLDLYNMGFLQWVTKKINKSFVNDVTFYFKLFLFSFFHKTGANLLTSKVYPSVTLQQLCERPILKSDTVRVEEQDLEGRDGAGT